MKNIQEFIESGILEAYVLGNATLEETRLVEEMASSSATVSEEIAAIQEALQVFALANAVEPNPASKPLLLATIDYTERLKNGEPPSFPPQLHDNSRIADYDQWLSHPDMVAPPDFEHLYAKIIGYTPQAFTALVWVREMAPQEVHDNEYEKFLVVEGTCDIIIGDELHSLKPGSYLAIPLHASHHVTVTSACPCKIILQRIAA